MSFSVSLNPCIASSGRSRKSLRLDATVRLCRKRFRRKARALISRSKTYFMKPKNRDRPRFSPPPRRLRRHPSSVRRGKKRGLSLFFESFEKRSEEHTSELQSPDQLVCRLLLEKKKNYTIAWPEREFSYSPSMLSPDGLRMELPAGRRYCARPVCVLAYIRHTTPQLTPASVSLL